MNIENYTKFRYTNYYKKIEKFNDKDLMISNVKK